MNRREFFSSTIGLVVAAALAPALPELPDGRCFARVSANVGPLVAAEFDRRIKEFGSPFKVTTTATLLTG
jgi:hypothetical protein